MNKLNQTINKLNQIFSVRRIYVFLITLIMLILPVVISNKLIENNKTLFMPLIMIVYTSISILYGYTLCNKIKNIKRRSNV